MQKSRNNRYFVIGLLVLIGIPLGSHLYDRYREQAEAELEIQKAARHRRLEQEAVALVADSELARNAKEIAAPDVYVVCVGTNLRRIQGEFGDPAPDLLRALQASIHKIRPESYCRDLTDRERPYLYRIASPHWESDRQVEVATMKSEGINGIVEDSEIYQLSLVDDHWEITKQWVGPPS